MEMTDIKIFQIVAGPVDVAYDFDEPAGQLTVWLGHYTVDAPKTAQHTNIEYPLNKWSIESAATVNAEEVE